MIVHFILSTLLSCILLSLKNPVKGTREGLTQVVSAVTALCPGREDWVRDLPLASQQDSELWECWAGPPPGSLGWERSSPRPHTYWICACLGHKSRAPPLLPLFFAYRSVCHFHPPLLSHIRGQRKDLSLNTENICLSIA